MSDESVEGTAAETPLTGGGRSTVNRRGNTVFREPGPWSSTVQQLLLHLEEQDYSGSPRVAGDGFDERGRETLTYIDGEIIHPGPWNDDALPVIGVMLRTLHDTTASFRAPVDAVWRQWFGRNLGSSNTVIGHCDASPWNILSRQGLPVALIDWETAGPVDPMIELAQSCWLNAGLYADDVAEEHGFPPTGVRAKQVRMLLDGYELPRAARIRLVDTMIEFAIHDAVEQVDEAGVDRTTTDPVSLWGITWRARSAGWMLRNRQVLESALS